jgi:hypothetical protein
MIKEKEDYSETHPELREGEVFLFNGMSETYDPLKWDTKRMGAVAYTSRGAVLPKYRPIFAQRKEYEEKKKDDEEEIRRRDTGMVFQAAPPSAQIQITRGGTCDVCGRPMYDNEGRECIAVNIAMYEHSEADRVKEAFGKQSFNICFVCFLRALGVKEPNKIEDKTGQDLIMNAPVVFGLLRQGHIPTIEKMLKEGATWEEIGKEIGWCLETAKEQYGWYVKALEKHLPPLQGEKE